MQRFKVAVPTEGGGIAFYPLYEWLHRHRDELPSDVDPDVHTSRQIRARLTKLGWLAADTATEVRLMPPEYRDTAAAGMLLSDAAQDLEDAAEPSLLVEEEQAAVGFRVEQQLQHFVADNLHTVQLNGSRVRPLEDKDGRAGLEFQTAVGRIDLLARDDKDGLVIFEFKRAKAPDAAIGQLTRYMGCIKSTIGADKQVTGMIVAPVISEDLRYSAKIVPNIYLYEFEMSFSLKPAHEVAAGSN